MTARTVIILGFAVILAGIVVAVVLTHVRRAELATFTETVAHLTRTRAAKVAAVLIWAWIGWHFLAR